MFSIHNNITINGRLICCEKTGPKDSTTRPCVAVLCAFNLVPGHLTLTHTSAACAYGIQPHSTGWSKKRTSFNITTEVVPELFESIKQHWTPFLFPSAARWHHTVCTFSYTTASSGIGMTSVIDYTLRWSTNQHCLFSY